MAEDGPADCIEIVYDCIEEISEPLLTFKTENVKDENDRRSEDIFIFQVQNKNGNTERRSREDTISKEKEHNVWQCENTNVVSHNKSIELIQPDAIKMEISDIGCQCCGCLFNTMYEAESHQCENSITFNNVIVCKNCQKVLESENDMDEHECHNSKKKQISNSPFSCSDCFKTFSLMSMLQKHRNLHNQNKKQTQKVNKGVKPNCSSDVDQLNHCQICNTTFSSQKNLKLHSKMHAKTQTKTIRDAMPSGTDDLSEENKFYCEICNKSFDHTLLSVHQNMHQNIEEHNCSICNRQFENQVSYEMHMQLHAEQPKKERLLQVTKPGARFACNYCGKEFLRPHEKVKHERIHTGEKPHECEVCGKSFRVSYSLTLHLRTHTDIRPFVCAQCNKRFKSYAVYSHHLNTHSEDRPYKCSMCPKSFRTSVQLCGHKNSHTKPYNCPECNRPFSSLYAVKMHMKTHNKTNKSNENLKNCCEKCGAVYGRMFALRFHMKEQHSSDLHEEKDKCNNIKSTTANGCINEDEVLTQAILPGEEIIIHSDW